MKTMLEFIQNILVKVSFDLDLFEKELNKAISWLVPSDIYKLKDWCLANFTHLNASILEQFTKAGY